MTVLTYAQYLRGTIRELETKLIVDKVSTPKPQKVTKTLTSTQALKEAL